MTTDATGPPRLLQSALEQLRLEGAIFFRSELTEGFAFESTPQVLAGALHPGHHELVVAEGEQIARRQAAPRDRRAVDERSVG